MEDELVTEKNNDISENKEYRYYNILIENIVQYSSDCEKVLYEKLFLKVDVPQLRNLLLKSFEESNGVVICTDE